MELSRPGTKERLKRLCDKITASGACLKMAESTLESKLKIVVASLAAVVALETGFLGGYLSLTSQIQSAISQNNQAQAQLVDSKLQAISVQVSDIKESVRSLQGQVTYLTDYQDGEAQARAGDPPRRRIRKGD